ncbi:hypothetical protein ACFQ0O_02690 [Saccharopolyspora spinosporotrichia]|uniref:hypothetical protein n=1 Tax=Saccharopolyspora erythraea TaxID=1836 RepID=UPI0001D315C9|nr:hypothetical protein [Saccharopolyspora erythraea]EQD84956.1 hypothetical protein N599_17390 [Saccharopolyspora erythraea D]
MNEVLKKAAILAGAAAGLLALAPVANADSADNDGVNVLNDNNISALPIQLCGNDIAVVGVIAKVDSTQTTQCVNAPIVDHPSQKS